jgi:hypothetical protein
VKHAAPIPRRPSAAIILVITPCPAPDRMVLTSAPLTTQFPFGPTVKCCHSAPLRRLVATVHVDSLVIGKSRIHGKGQIYSIHRFPPLLEQMAGNFVEPLRRQSLTRQPHVGSSDPARQPARAALPNSQNRPSDPCPFWGIHGFAAAAALLRVLPAVVHRDADFNDRR